MINTPAPRSYSLRHSMFCFSIFGICHFFTMLLKCRNSKISSFLQIFCHNMLLPWEHTFCYGRKCILHIYTPRQTSGLNSMRIGQKLRKWFMMQDFPPFLPYAVTMATISATVKKWCLAHLHPKANICAKFYENW